MPTGLYISVPFCRTKCSYCNFASDVFSRAIFDRYLDRVCNDLQGAQAVAEDAGCHFETRVDSVYLGGGTPTLLDTRQLRRGFDAIGRNFRLDADAEVTVECAPGTLSGDIIATLVEMGVNRVSLGVQSFVDGEAASVGRLHKREIVLEEIVRLRDAGIFNINIDLIAGLPHQSLESWKYSLDETLAAGVPHVSVYMLEVDEESRLGRELIAGGTKYHAHFVPDEDLTADLYLLACDRFDAAGIKQYEISNFAGDRFQSKHNLKYWTRQPYFGFGVDAHSMLKVDAQARTSRYDPSHQRSDERSAKDVESVRFATPDALEKFFEGGGYQKTLVSQKSAVEEAFFLGLRLNRGVDLSRMETEFGTTEVASHKLTIDDLVSDGLLEQDGSNIRLSARGRLLSNEVFEKFVFEKAA